MARKITIRPFMGTRYVRSSQAASAQALQEQFRQNMGGIIDNLRAFIDEINGVLPEILVEALEETFGKSLEYCPEKTGALRESGYLEAESYRGGAAVAIGYGKGGQPDYAIYVHEMPYAHAAPTRAKFLEAALDEDYFTILNKIPRLIRESAGT